MKEDSLSAIDVLKRSHIFSGMSDNDTAALGKLVVRRKVKTGEYIFWDGDRPDWIYIIDKGKVKISKYSSAGKEFVISFFGPGDILGEVAILENKPYPASAQAISDTGLLMISREQFMEFLGGSSDAAIRVIGTLSERLRIAQNRLRDLAGERVEQRVARILLMLHSRLGTDIPFTRQEIADMAGTTTETAIRVMSRLKDGGMVRSSRGKISITDEEKLKLLSEGPPQV